MILASGCFDGLSATHARYLDAASQYRDGIEPLVVTVERDSYIRRIKGRAPYWPLADRAYAVSRLQMVDQVYAQPEHEAVPDVIRKLRPRVFVKGPEWRDYLDGAHLEACRAVGAKVCFTDDYGPHWSDVR